jgi:toxin YhaV
MLTINRWTILAHPLFLDQLEKLIATVEVLKAKRPEDFQKSGDAKLLAALVQLVSNTIPSDPTAAIYRQGSTLGGDRKHWFRAKFGNGRFRLFFRYSSAQKVIIFAWVNDETSLRTYGARTDAYKVFKSMLDDGNPPDGWDQLYKAASAKSATDRMSVAASKSE